MREEDIAKAIRTIAAKPSLREKVIRMDGRRRHSGAKLRAVKVFAAAAVILLVCTLGLRYKLINDDSTGGTLLGGISIKAYAANGNEVDLSQNVEAPLGKYSPFMNSVPGFPFKIGFISMEADKIQVHTDRGAILNWNSPDGKVESKGKDHIVKPGDTIYWSPLEEEKGVVNEAMLKITAWKNGKKVAESEVLIKGGANAQYTAEIQKLISYPEQKPFSELNP